MADILAQIESAVAEVPENIGRALVFIGQQLEALAARIDRLEGGGTGGGDPSAQ